jgi:hypothetical protein
MALNVGAGILTRMAVTNDHPLEDSTFKTNADGTLVEKTLGTQGLYVASNASGQWESVGPLPIAG